MFIVIFSSYKWNIEREYLVPCKSFKNSFSEVRNVYIYIRSYIYIYVECIYVCPFWKFYNKHVREAGASRHHMSPTNLPPPWEIPRTSRQYGNEASNGGLHYAEEEFEPLRGD